MSDLNKAKLIKLVHHLDNKQNRIVGGVFLFVLISVSLIIVLTANWSLNIMRPDGSFMTFHKKAYKYLLTAEGSTSMVPLERLFWQAGHQTVDQIAISYKDDLNLTYKWQEIAHDSFVNKTGHICIAGACMPASAISVNNKAEPDRMQFPVTDLAPTIAAALGAKAPADAIGTPFIQTNTILVTAILLDGFGYQIMKDASANDLTPNLDRLEDPLIATSVYPPGTRVAMSAFLTGTNPEINGVTTSQMRNLAVQDLCASLKASGKTSLIIEAESVPINLPDCEIQLSSDRDGNGLTDDNVLNNAIDALNQSELRDFIFIHFHGIDDAGHTYGIGSQEHNLAIKRLDFAVGQIISMVPKGSLVLIFADHGMHPDPLSPSYGTHGNLFPDDMLIPVFIDQIQ